MMSHLRAFPPYPIKLTDSSITSKKVELKLVSIITQKYNFYISTSHKYYAQYISTFV